MMSNRMPLALILCIVLFVTAGFAATQKIQHNDASGDWNDLSLQNDSSLQNRDLLNAGSSVSGGSGSASLSIGMLEGSSLVLSPAGTDSWNGGTDNWNDPNKNNINWSTGSPPGPTDDVVINSGGNDLVYLNTSPSIASLTIGGTTGGSQLRGDGTAQSLTIAGSLTLNQTGQLFLSSNDTVTVGTNVTVMPANPKDPGAIDLENGSTLRVIGNVYNSRDIETSFYGSGGNTITVNGTLTNNTGARLDLEGTSDVAKVGIVVNKGSVSVGRGAELNLTNEPNGITHVVAGSVWVIAGNFAVAGVANTGFANLNNVEGEVYLGNNHTTSIAPSGGQLTVSSGGRFEADYPGTTGQINGNVNNSGTISTSDDCCGGVTLTITGTLTNNPGGQLRVGYAAHNAGFDIVNVGMLVNNGRVDVFRDETLNLGSVVNGGTLNNAGVINVGGLSPLLAGLGVLHGPSYTYTQLANGTLGVIITPTSYGVINVKGSALLNGTLDVLLQPGFDPAVGSIYKILFAYSQEISGDFSTIENQCFSGYKCWIDVPHPGDGYVDLEVIDDRDKLPEPATLLVLIPGLLGAGYGLRRKLLG